MKDNNATSGIQPDNLSQRTQDRQEFINSMIYDERQEELHRFLQTKENGKGKEETTSEAGE